MSEAITAATATPAQATAADVAAGTAPVRIVSGTHRVQVQVNGQWYDLTGIAKAALLNGDRRYAATITFSEIGSISADAAGAAPAGIDGSLKLGFGKQSTAPIRTFSAAPDPVSAPASTLPPSAPTTVAASAGNAAVAAIGAVARLLNQAQAKPAAATPGAAP